MKFSRAACLTEMSDLDLDFVYIPRIWEANGESEIFRRIHLFLKLASTLVYFRRGDGPTYTYTRQRVLYQVMKLKPCVVPEVQQLFDIMQEAALAYKIEKAELETATQPAEQLFPKELLERWYLRKVELTGLIKEHKAAVKTILKLQKYFSTRYANNETLWEVLGNMPSERSIKMSRREKKLLLYNQTTSQEKLIMSKIYAESCSLRAEIEAVLQNKVSEGISNLRLVAGYKCPRIDLAEICTKTYAATSKKYSFVRSNMLGDDSAYGFLPKVITTKVKSSDFVQLTAEAKKRPSSPEKVALPKIVYITYWGEILDPKDRGKYTCERPVKPKIVSTEAGKGFGWTRPSIFSSKEWVIYYLEHAKNPESV